jgi:hypothetical protein
VRARNASFCLRNDPVRVRNDSLCVRNDPVRVRNDSLCVRNDLVRVRNDSLCVRNDSLRVRNGHVRACNGGCLKDCVRVINMREERYAKQNQVNGKRENELIDEMIARHGQVVSESFCLGRVIGF